MKTHSLATVVASLCLLPALAGCPATPVQPTDTVSVPPLLATPVQALVSDAEGKPLAGVRLRFSHPLQPQFERQTDASGQADLQGLRSGIPYLLSASGAGLVPRQQTIQVPAGATKGVALRLRMTLEKAQLELSGQISDANGQPLAAAVVQAGDASVETGSDGRYSLALAKTSDQISAFKQGYAACTPVQGACRLQAQAISRRLRTPEALSPLGLSAETFRQQSNSLIGDSRTAGYEVSSWPGEALDPARDTLWLPAPAKALSEAQLGEIGQFVRNGGKLVVNSEWAGYGQLELESLRKLLANFGLAPGSDSLQQGRNLGISLFDAPHPLISGLKSLSLYRSGSIQLLLSNQARLLAYSPADGFRIAAIGGHAVLGCALAGKGKIVVLGDSSLWLEDDADGNGVSNYREADNARLWKNILGW